MECDLDNPCFDFGFRSFPKMSHCSVGLQKAKSKPNAILPIWTHSAETG